MIGFESPVQFAKGDAVLGVKQSDFQLLRKSDTLGTGTLWHLRS
jgi:hypothetical protein